MGCARDLKRLIDCFAGNALIGTVHHVIIAEDDGIGDSGRRPEAT